MTQRIIYIFLICLLLGRASPARADALDLKSGEEALRRALQELVVGFDEDALVTVQMRELPAKRPKKADVPFVAPREGDPAPDPTSESIVVDVDVYTSVHPFPREATRIFEAMAKGYGKTVSVRYQKPLQGFQTPAKRLKDKPIKLPDRSDTAIAIDTLNKTITALKSLIDGTIKKFPPKAVWVEALKVGYAGLAALGVIFMMWHHWALSRGFRHLARVVQQSQKSLDQTPSRMGNVGPETPARPVDSRAPGADDGPLGLQLLQTLAVDSAWALLADCYWCEADAYAAYVWARLPLATKVEVIKKWPPMKGYALYLVQVPERYASHAQHPYYLSPLATAHLDQSVLTQVVRRHPRLYRMLSPVRQAALPMGALELLQLEKKPSTDTEADLMAMLAQLPGSALRTITTADKRLVNHVDEESVLLQQEDLDLDDMERLISLVWSARLPDPILAPLLESLSAMELAQAWAGPPEILARLESLLPEKKQRLVASYRQRVSPDRGSPAFAALHAMVIKELKRITPDQEIETHVAA